MDYKEFKSTCKEIFKKNQSKLLAFSLIFGLVIIGAVFVNLLYFLLISVIAFGLIILPLLFSFQVAVIKGSVGGELEYQDFSSNAKKYFNPRFHGVYNGFFSFLKMLGVLFVLVFVVTSIYYMYSSDYLIHFVELINAGQNEAAIKYLEENINTILPYYDIVISTCMALSFGSFFIFLHKSLTTTYFSLTYPVMPSVAKKINKSVHKEVRSVYTRACLSTSWPIPVLYLVGVALGILIGVVFEIDSYFAIVIGVSLGVLFASPFIGIYLISVYRCFYLFKDSYQQFFKVFITTSVNTLNSASNIPEEKKKELKEALDRLTDELGKEKQNGKEIIENEDNNNQETKDE